MDKRVFTEIETAAYLGMSRSYLRQSRMEGNRDNRTPAPPFIRIGRSIRYLKEDLDLWLDALPKYQQLNQVPIDATETRSANSDTANNTNATR
jgi:predicted DNA-binding transcriptional regulator AlpA